LPNTESAKKRLRQNRKRAAVNKGYRTRVRTLLKKARAESDPKAAAELYRKASSELDHAVSRGTLHRNTAARHKARLAKRVQNIGGTIA
jgi:small subunit ribosomal protein S20